MINSAPFESSESMVEWTLKSSSSVIGADCALVISTSDVAAGVCAGYQFSASLMIPPELGCQTSVSLAAAIAVSIEHVATIAMHAHDSLFIAFSP